MNTDDLMRIRASGEPYLLGRVYMPFPEDPRRAFMIADEPDIITLGNSRTLQIRQQFFNENYRYFTYAHVEGMSDLTSYLIDIKSLDIMPPKILIVILDPWWFVGDADGPALLLDGVGEASSIGVLPMLLKDIVSGKVLPHAFLTPPYRHTIGIQAWARGAGFRRDGSYDYGSIGPALTDRRNGDYQFHATLARLHHGDRTFTKGATIREDKAATLRDFFREAEARGIHVVSLFAPTAPTVFREMQAPEYGMTYGAEASRVSRALAEAHGHSFTDLSDPATLGLTDADFFDGLHWSETSNAKAMLRIAETDPVLREALRAPFLRERINESAPGQLYLFK